MSLSEQEQRALREIEQSLLAEDPKFGSSVSDSGSFGGSAGALTLRGVALVVVGLLMLLGGAMLSQISLWFIALSIAGFLIMFAAGVWMLRGGGTSSGFGSELKKGPTKPSQNSNGMGAKLEEGFRRRFEDN